MTDEVGDAGAARQLRAERAARQRARKQSLAMATVHERFMCALEARGLLDRGLEFLPTDAALAERARAGPRSHLAGVRRPRRVLQDRPDRGPRRTRDLPDEEWFTRTLRSYFPTRVRRALRRPARDPPAAPRDHHHLPRQRDGQPRRHHLRLPLRGGDGRRLPSKSPAPTRSCREIFGLRDFVAAVEALDHRVADGRADRAVPDVPATARPRRAVVPADPARPDRHRRRDRALRARRRAARADAARPAGGRGAQGAAGGGPGTRPPGRAGAAGPARRRACSIVFRRSTSPRSRSRRRSTRSRSPGST